MTARAVNIRTEQDPTVVAPEGPLQQRILIVGQGSTGKVYASEVVEMLRISEVAEVFGSGSPIHRAAERLFNSGIDRVAIAPVQEETSATAAESTITPTVSVGARDQMYLLSIAGVEKSFNVPATAVLADILLSVESLINKDLSLPVTALKDATKITLTSKWKALGANEIKVTGSGPVGARISFAITDMAGGTLEEDPATILAKALETDITLVINTLTSETLSSFEAFCDTRWSERVHRPVMCITGSTLATIAEVIAITDSVHHREDRNIFFPVFGSESLGMDIATAAAYNISQVGTDNPPQDYAGSLLKGVAPAALVPIFTERDLLVESGSCSFLQRDGAVYMEDTFTMYHPDGVSLPIYQYAVDVVRIQNVTHRVATIFESAIWNGCPIIEDGQPTTNPKAKSPSMAVAELRGLQDELALDAIITGTGDTKKGITVTMPAGNNKKLEIVFPVKLSGNGSIYDIVQSVNVGGI